MLQPPSLAHSLLSLGPQELFACARALGSPLPAGAPAETASRAIAARLQGAPQELRFFLPLEALSAVAGLSGSASLHLRPGKSEPALVRALMMADSAAFVVCEQVHGGIDVSLPPELPGLAAACLGAVSREEFARLDTLSLLIRGLLYHCGVLTAQEIAVRLPEHATAEEILQLIVLYAPLHVLRAMPCGNVPCFIDPHVEDPEATRAAILARPTLPPRVFRREELLSAGSEDYCETPRRASSCARTLFLLGLSPEEGADVMQRAIFARKNDAPADALLRLLGVPLLKREEREIYSAAVMELLNDVSMYMLKGNTSAQVQVMEQMGVWQGDEETV